MELSVQGTTEDSYLEKELKILPGWKVIANLEPGKKEFSKQFALAFQLLLINHCDQANKQASKQPSFRSQNILGKY